MTSQQQIHLGKKGLTEDFLEVLKQRFEKSKITNLKICVLKSARESREDVKRYAKEIKEKLGDKFTTRVLGFCIFVRKWRKSQD
jgi:RNA-binding protein YhbY